MCMCHSNIKSVQRKYFGSFTHKKPLSFLRQNKVSFKGLYNTIEGIIRELFLSIYACAELQLYKQPILNKYLLKTVLLVSRALESILTYDVMLHQELMLCIQYIQLRLFRTKALNGKKLLIYYSE